MLSGKEKAGERVEDVDDAPSQRGQHQNRSREAARFRMHKKMGW